MSNDIRFNNEKLYYETTKMAGYRFGIEYDRDKYREYNIWDFAAGATYSKEFEYFFVHIYEPQNNEFFVYYISIYEPKVIYPFWRPLGTLEKEGLYLLANEYWDSIITELKNSYLDEDTITDIRAFGSDKDPSKIIYPDSPPDYRLLP